MPKENDQLAVALRAHSAGDLSLAKRHYELHLKAFPKDTKAKGWLGVLLAQMGESERAYELLSLAVDQNPNITEFQSARGNLLFTRGDYFLALDVFDHVLRLTPKDCSSLLGKSSCEIALQRLDAAKGTLQYGLGLYGQVPELWFNFGRALRGLGNQTEAKIAFEKAIKLRPKYNAARAALGELLFQMGALTEVVETLSRLEIPYVTDQIRTLIAEAYRRLGEPQKALNVLSSGKNVGGGVGCLVSSGAAWKDLGEFDKSKACYEKALTLAPQSPEALRSLALLKLAQIDLKDGWQLLLRVHRMEQAGSIKALPEWDGQPTQESILVLAEQGLGDQILFYTLLREVSKRAPRLTVQLDERLYRLYAESYPSIKFISRHAETHGGRYSRQIRGSHLPSLLRCHLDDFKNQTRKSLNPTEQAQSLNRDRPYRWGISWRSFGASYSTLKSLALRDLKLLFEIPDTEILNLQYGEIRDEIEALQQSTRTGLCCVPNLNLTNDIYGVSQAILSCDSVITTSNTTAHLAGALGVRTVLLCPRFAGRFWYWNQQLNGRSLWYPSIEIVEINQEDFNATLRQAISLLKTSPRD